jgi:hypothetical protein
MKTITKKKRKRRKRKEMICFENEGGKIRGNEEKR